MISSFRPTAETDPDATESKKDVAKKFNMVPKIVFSQTLQKTAAGKIFRR